MRISSTAIAGIVLLAGCSAGVQADARGQLRVQTASDVCWSGATGSTTFDGCGNKTIPIDGNNGRFAANAGKLVDGSDELTLTLLVGGKEVDRSSTTAAFGSVIVSGP